MQLFSTEVKALAVASWGLSSARALLVLLWEFLQFFCRQTPDVGEYTITQLVRRGLGAERTQRVSWNEPLA